MDENDKDMEKFLPKWYLELLKMKRNTKSHLGNNAPKATIFRFITSLTSGSSIRRFIILSAFSRSVSIFAINPASKGRPQRYKTSQ